MIKLIICELIKLVAYEVIIDLIKKYIKSRNSQVLFQLDVEKLFVHFFVYFLINQDHK